jgi:hypothetical protein
VLRLSDISRSILPFISEPLSYATAALGGTAAGKCTIGAHTFPVKQRQGHLGDVNTYLNVLHEISCGIRIFAESVSESEVLGQENLILTAARLVICVSDAASPFSIESDANSAVHALGAMTESLKTLAVVHRLLPTDFGDARGPPLPELLPHVHLLWPAFVCSVQRGHTAAARTALAAIPVVASLSGGDFLAERVRSDLWPSLRLMMKGSCPRLRLAAVQCIADLAATLAVQNSLSRVLADVAEALCACALLGDAELRHITHIALERVASVDPDSVFWLKLQSGLEPMPPLPSRSELFADSLCK